MNFKIIKTKEGTVLLRRSTWDYDKDNVAVIVYIEYFKNINNNEDHFEEKLIFGYQHTAKIFIEDFSEDSALKWIKKI